jgi:hypothetical protein
VILDSRGAPIMDAVDRRKWAEAFGLRGELADTLAVLADLEPEAPTGTEPVVLAAADLAGLLAICEQPKNQRAIDLLAHCWDLLADRAPGVCALLEDVLADQEGN